MKNSITYYVALFVALVIVRIILSIYEAYEASTQLRFSFLFDVLPSLLIALVDYCIVAPIGAVIKWLLSKITNKNLIPSTVSTMIIYVAFHFIMKSI